MSKVKNYPARLPMELWNKLDKAAKENERSVMKEIIFRLKKSFENVG